MKRAGLIVAGVVGIVGVAGVAGWTLARDTAEPVDVEDLVSSFRTDTDAGPELDGRSPIPVGVYVYDTSGFETTDALTGVTHRYPRQTTITVAAAPCGVRLTWRALKGRSTAWTYCVSADGWELRSQDERHTFFGSTQSTAYLCSGTPIRPWGEPTEPWRVTCETDTSVERGSAEIVSREVVRVGAELAAVEHVRKTTTISGEIRGPAQHDLWFDSESGLPVKIVMTTRTTNDSPIGDVHYEEQVTLRLTSLEPRR